VRGVPSPSGRVREGAEHIGEKKDTRQLNGILELPTINGIEPFYFFSILNL